MQINQCIYVIAHSIHVARLCLRGNRNDLITHGLSNLLVVEPATVLQVSHRGCEPKINPAQGRFDFWLCSVCNSRTELIEIGQEIDNVKNELNLHLCKGTRK